MDHAPGQHDDIANAVAGACVLAAKVATACRLASSKPAMTRTSPDEVQRRTDEEWGGKRNRGSYKMKEVLDRQGYHFPGD